MSVSPVAPSGAYNPFGNPFYLSADVGIPAFVGSVPVPPGNPDQLLAAAGRHASAATELGRLAARLRSVTSTISSGQSWCSPASGVFAAAGAAAAGSYSNAAAATGQAATSLATYATELDQAQRVARAANAAAAELNVARTALQGQRMALDLESSARPLGAPPDPGLTARYAQVHAQGESIGQGAAHVGTLGQQAQLMATDAGRKAAAAFEQVAAMTLAARQEAARSAARAAAPDEGSSAWDVAQIIGLSAVDVGLFAADVAQLGVDPVTDAATGVTVARTGTIAARLFGRGALHEAEHQAEEAAASAAARDLATGAERKAMPQWLKDRLASGQKFNVDNHFRYDANEVRLSNNKVVDSVNWDREIVFRRETQIASVKPQTFEKYLSEFKGKYLDENIVVQAGPRAEALFPGQIGEALRGVNVFEVPVQAAGVPQEAIAAADKLSIIIRDVTGHVYR